MDLHPLELKVIEGLKKLGGKGTAPAVAEAAGIEKTQAERFGYSLSQKNLLVLEKKEHETRSITGQGKEYLEKGFPEIRMLKEANGGITRIEEIQKKCELTSEEVSASIGILNNNGYARISTEDDGPHLTPTELGKNLLREKYDLSEKLKIVSEGGEIEKPFLSNFRRRKLIEISTHAEYVLELKEGAEAVSKESKNVIHQLTHEMIKTGSWKNKKMRGYDMKAAVKNFYPGKLHPLTIARNKIRRIFFDLGFEEVEGPLVESSFWNFDALFQPQDHPSRDLADTFYLKNPASAKLPDMKTLDEVKKAHEGGIKGSLGWGYKWNPEFAKKPILRTHTTAVTARALARIKPPAKVFCIGRTFRNETVDFKHLPEFTQIDGIVADENVTFKDLLGYLKEFYCRLGFEKIRFRPAYFPYTEMSVEPEIYLEEREEWLEMGGAGIFRPEVTEPLGIDVPVLAWGLSLERPIMLKLGLSDIRSFYYFNDLKWLRDVPLI